MTAAGAAMAALQQKDQTLPPDEPSVASIVACAALFVALWLVWVLWSRHAAPADDKIFYIVRFNMMLAFLTLSHYSIILVEAYGIAKQLDRHEAFSGWVIGVYQLCLGIGSSVTFLILQVQPNLCLSFPRLMVVEALLIHLVGAISYAVVAGRYVPASCDDQLMLFSRGLCGFGAGQLAQFCYVSMARVLSDSDKVKGATSFRFGGALGVGCGPIMATMCGAIHQIFGRPTVTNDFVLVGVAQAAGAAVLLVCMACLYPGLSEFIEEEEEEEDEQAGAPAQQHAAQADAAWESCAAPQSALPKKPTSKRYEQEEPDFQKKRWVILGCVGMSTIRGLGVSSLEAASSLVLETDYHWPAAANGIAISATFLAIIPVKTAYSWYADRLSTIGWMRGLMAVCLVGAILLPVCHKAWWILMIDACFFPCLYWSDGLGIGIMQQHFLPDGSYFDINHGTLFQMLATIAAARTIGPVAARAQIGSTGFTGYCIQQVVLVLIFFGVLELVVKPNMRSA